MFGAAKEGERVGGKKGLVWCGPDKAKQWPEGSVVLVQEIMPSGQPYYTADNYWRPDWLGKCAYFDADVFALLREGHE